MTNRLTRLSVLLAIVALAAGCAAGKAFVRGESAMRAGNLDEAVAQYRTAAQAAPDNATYRIALQRAMLAASRWHIEKAHEFEAKDQLEAALGEYRQAVDNDPTNRSATAKVAELDRTIRDRIEAARPKPAIQQMRENARRASAEPALLNLTQVLGPISFRNAPYKDVLTFIASSTGINIMYDRDVVDRATTVQLDGATLEQALNQIMLMNQLSYNVINDKSIFVFNDNAQNHAKYDAQVVRTFYLSNADATEISQILSTIIRVPGLAVQPGIQPNRTNNTITVRATAAVVGVIEKIINQQDKPRAEIVVDVEILEVERARAKSYGLNLSDYALGTVFSPEVSPSSTTTGAAGATGSTGGVTAPVTGGTTTTNTGRSTGPTQVVPPPPFNLNTISRGVTTADFYLAVPTAIVKFLESDSHTKVLAKPQLRGAEGAKLSLKLGQSVPIISTSYTPIATGGAGVNPLSSYQYRDVGVNIDMTPTVTLEGDIRLDLTLDDSQLGADKSIAGTTVPTFVQRTLTTRLRLRDGESNLLAGLLQDQELKKVTGFTGLINVPGFRQLLSGNDISTDQLDIIMLLTPHIVRTHEITEDDLKPIYIGSTQNMGVTGPPPLIAQPQVEPAPAAPPPPPPAAAQPLLPGPGGTTVSAPPGSSPVPGTVLVPTPPVQTPPAVAPQPQPEVTTPPAAPSATPAGGAVPTTSSGVGSAQVLITPPGPTLRVGGGPYTVPLSISDASRISTITLTLIYDPTKLRVRSVQEGSFMRAGGTNVSFAQQVNGNRIDITLSRGADATGASGTGLLAAVLFDAIAPGAATLSMSGTATGPGGTAMGLRFTPVTVTVQQ